MWQIVQDSHHNKILYQHLFLHKCLLSSVIRLDQTDFIVHLSVNPPHSFTSVLIVRSDRKPKWQAFKITKSSSSAHIHTFRGQMQVFRWPDRWPCFLLHVCLRSLRSLRKSVDRLINEEVNVKHFGPSSQKVSTVNAHSQLLCGQYPLSSSVF